MTPPRLLVATTTWWPSAARLVVVFQQLGADVSAICPVGHPLRVLATLKAIHAYSSWAPLQALVCAIRRQKPDIIVPTDDRTVAHLHALHASAERFGPDSDMIAALIERSLGRPAGFALSGTRQRLLDAVSTGGVPVPPGRRIRTRNDLRAWHAEHPEPYLIKSEGSWGGSGVVLTPTLEAAEAAFLVMSRPIRFRKALRILLVDRDPFPFVEFLHRERREVTVQAHVSGRQANIMATCWKGRLLGTISVEVLQAQGRTGAATVVRPIDSPEMEAAAMLVADRLGMSGFFGLDFIIEEATGRTVLIEMNPRATQLGHLIWKGRSLAARLFAEATGTALGVNEVLDRDRPVAMFPQALRFAVEQVDLTEAELDVPWTEPELVAELLRPPWTKRSLLARLEARLRPNDAYGTVLSRRDATRILATFAAPSANRQGVAAEARQDPGFLGTGSLKAGSLGE